MFALRRVPLTPSVRAFSTTATRASFAKISIIGHLAATPEVQATSTGHELVKYAVATNSGPKENRQTSWWNIACFTPEGKYRDLLTSLPKGSLLYVEGDATMNAYQDNEGKNRSSLSIVERKMEILKTPQDAVSS